MLRRSCERLFYIATNATPPELPRTQPEIKRADVQPSDIPIQAKAEKRPWSAGRLAAAIALSAGILAALWVSSRPVYGYGLFALYRQGYSWFNMNTSALV